MRDLLTRHGLYYGLIIILYIILLPFLAIRIDGNWISAVFMACLVYESVNFMHLSSRYQKYSLYGKVLQAAFPFLLFLVIPASFTWLLVSLSVLFIVISVATDFVADKELIHKMCCIKGFAVYVIIIALILTSFISTGGEKSSNPTGPIVPSMIDDSNHTITMES